MAKLSILVPVQRTETAALEGLLAFLPESPEYDLEIVFGTSEPLGTLAAPADNAPSVKQVHLNAVSASTQEQWNALIEASSGDWLCLVHPEDALDPALCAMVAFIEKASSSIAALAWNALEIDPEASPDTRLSVGVPIDANIAVLDKATMLKAFFMWENSSAAPRMPFGLYHGVVRRDLALNIVKSLAEAERLSSAPRYEWAARSLLLADQIAFCPRPMSAINKRQFIIDPAGQPTAGFPLNGSLGIAGAIAEIQHTVFLEMAATWGSGAETAFARACMIDCMLERDPAVYEAKTRAYLEALSAWSSTAASAFQPHFSGGLPPETRRGLFDGTLFVDRFIGGARDARSFHHVIQSFLLPVSQICR